MSGMFFKFSVYFNTYFANLEHTSCTLRAGLITVYCILQTFR